MSVEFGENTTTPYADIVRHGIPYAAGGRTSPVSWETVDGEILFYVNDVPSDLDGAIDAIGGDRGEAELNLLKHVLAEWAPRSYEPETKTQSAAIHIIKDGASHNQRRAFVGTNLNHVDGYQRFDAEANTILKVKETLLKEEINRLKKEDEHFVINGKQVDINFAIDTTYLMIKHGVSKFTTPCGTCRDELLHHSDKDSKLVCVPFLSSEEAKKTELSLAVTPEYAEICFGGEDPYDKHANINNVPERHAFKMMMSELLPHREVDLVPDNETERGKWIDRIHSAYAALNRAETSPYYTLTEDQKQALQLLAQINESVQEPGRVRTLENVSTEENILPNHYDNYTLENINRYMAETIKLAYGEHCPDGNKVTDSKGRETRIVDRIRTVVVVTEDGKVYSGVNVMGPKLPTKPPADVAALMNGLNQKNIKEVFVMEMEPDRIAPKEIKDEEEITERDPHRLDYSNKCLDRLATFTGRALDRINKNTYAEGDLGSPDRKNIRGQVIGARATLHVIPFNDGTLKKEDIESGMVSKPVSEWYSHAYVNPKSAADGNQERGCC